MGKWQQTMTGAKDMNEITLFLTFQGVYPWKKKQTLVYNP